MYFSFRILLVFLVNFAEKSHATPPSYCLEDFNRSDCNLPPQRVFSYYKPGSRCEIETWRGCPTLNKFETEEECSNICIFIDINDADIMHLTGAVNEICLYKPVHVKRCSDNLSKVFVYNTILKSCIPITWGGCPRPKNVFHDEVTCVTVCSQITGTLMRKTKKKKFDQIINSLLNDISDYLKKLNISITTDSTTTKSKMKNVTGNMVAVKQTSEKFLKQTIITEKIENNENNEDKEDKEDSDSYTSEVPTIRTSIKAGKPLKATDSKTLAFESTTEATTMVATTTAETTTKTTETTELVTSTSMTETPKTTQRTVKATIKRGTAKQVVLPQDL